jgi:hypothetical protein
VSRSRFKYSGQIERRSCLPLTSNCSDFDFCRWPDRGTAVGDDTAVTSQQPSSSRAAAEQHLPASAESPGQQCSASINPRNAEPRTREDHPRGPRPVAPFFPLPSSHPLPTSSPSDPSASKWQLLAALRSPYRRFTPRSGGQLVRSLCFSLSQAHAHVRACVCVQARARARLPACARTSTFAFVCAHMHTHVRMVCLLIKFVSIHFDRSVSFDIT